MALVAASGCNTALRADPNGLRCDPGGICPPGFDCIAQVCRSKGGSTDGGDLCAAVACDMPPASVCQDANTKRSFAGGTCDKTNGQCIWTSQDVTCAMGCQTGLCIGDPCNTVTCNTPPAATCVTGTSLRTFAVAGTCSNGTCSYAPTDTTCATTCVNGACTGTSPALNFAQTFPQVRHRIDAIDVAPASGGDRVLAVGPGGKVSYFNGTAWAAVTGGGNSDLTAVWFSGANTAWIVGKSRTVLRWNGTALTTVNGVPGSGSSNFVGVHGINDTDVVLADETGGWWRFKLNAWTNGALATAANQPYAMRAVYVDGLGKTRIVGKCAATSTTTSRGCVAYNDPLGASPTTWYEDLDAVLSDGLLSAGPAVAVGTDAWVGRFPSNGVMRHDATNGAIDTTGVPTLPSGNGVVGITGTGIGAAARATFMLSAGNTATASYLYRATSAGLDSAPLFDFYFNASSLSKNESGGVVVADTRNATTTPVAPVANNIVRRGPLTNEALDLGEDWVGFEPAMFPVGPAGASVQSLVVVSAFNDIAVRPLNGSRWVFRRGPASETTDVAAGTGFALITGRNGLLYKFTVAAGFTAVTESVTTDFSAACRASDTELYAVATGGFIVSYTGGTTATLMTSPTTKNLLDVHCPNAGGAVACGQDGTVLVYRNSAWSQVTPAFPATTAQLTSCRQVGGAIYVAGNGAFAKFEAGAWTTLPSRPQLSDLVVLAPNDIYATSGAEVVRFDGTSWTSRFTAPSVLRAGGQVGARVVYAGGAGVVVESQ